MIDPTAFSTNPDPELFRAALCIATADGVRPLDDVLDPWQRDDFLQADNGWRRVAGLPLAPGPTYLRCYRERPRGHSKSSDAAVEICFALVASADKINGVIAAGDEDQAAIVRDAMERLIRANDWLAGLLRVERSRVVNVVTGSEAVIITADAPTSFGLLADWIYCDELVHWSKPDLWHSLLSAAAKKAQCLLSVGTNAGWENHWAYPLRQAVQVDPAWLFQRLEGPIASWITAENLAEQKRLLPPSVYARLWGNRTASGSGDSIDYGLIQASIKLTGPVPPNSKGMAYVAGVDLGITRDASAIVILAKSVGHWEEVEPTKGPEKSFLQSVLEDLRYSEDMPTEPEQTSLYVAGDGISQLALVKVFDPRVKRFTLSEIEAELIALHAIYGFQTVSCDEWQAALLVERLRNAGVPATTTPPTGPNLRVMAETTLTAFSEKTVQLYPAEVLESDLKSLRVVEKSYGLKLESARGDSATGHADSASAFCLALMAARRLDQYRQTRISGPLLVWP